MLTSEVYYRLPVAGQSGRWWFAILELGRLGQILDRLVVRRCRDRKDARRQAAEALKNERNKRDAA